MAEVWVRPRKETNGSGTSYDDALNTFAGLTWGSNRYLVDGGTLRETIAFGASGAQLVALNLEDPPVVDCEGVRASGINLNSATNCEIAGFTVTGQNAAAVNAAIRVTGSGHYIHHCHTYNNRHGIHLNSAANIRVQHNLVDVGRADDPTQGWGVRLNGAGCTGYDVSWNRFVSTRAVPSLYVVGAMFGVCVELNTAGAGRVRFNTLNGAMCDQIIARGGSVGPVIEGNLAFGTGMLDGIDALNSDAVTLRLNTIIHPGDVPGHAGPCMAIGDDYGTGVASTNVTVAHNLLWANNRLCMSIRPLGAGFASTGNRLYRTNGDGDAVCNVNEGAGFVATNMTAWLAKGYVTEDTYGDPLVGQFGAPLVGSPLLTGRTDGIARRDIRGFQSRRHIGAYGQATLMRQR